MSPELESFRSSSRVSIPISFGMQVCPFPSSPGFSSSVSKLLFRLKDEGHFLLGRLSYEAPSGVEKKIEDGNHEKHGNSTNGRAVILDRKASEKIGRASCRERV